MKENKIDLAAKALLGVLLGLFALLCGCSETTPKGNAPTNLSTPKSPVDNGPKREVTFFAVGDIMLSLNLNYACLKTTAGEILHWIMQHYRLQA